MITLNDIRQAHDRIRPFIHRTPVMTNTFINKLTGAEIYFKCENFQKIGAFKARGGLNAVLQLAAQGTAKAIVTHSSGNHAQAIAYAARQVGLPAYIVMPRNAPVVKKQAVIDYGATVIECEPTLEAREAAVEEIISREGAYMIHPFDNDHVITGQATAAKELIEDCPFTFNTILAPVGGGGLLSGTSLSTAYLSPDTNVIAGEPEGAADAILSFKSGNVEKAPYIDTIADGLLTHVSERTLQIFRQHVKEVLLASEDEIIAAMKLVWERMKIIIEPSAAVAFAAVLKNKTRFDGQKVGIIITGGNVDLARLPF